MKRSSPMKRTQLKRSYLKRKPISDERRLEAQVFRDAVRDRAVMMDGPRLYICERCEQGVLVIEAHHLCSRTRGKGHAWLNDPERNGCPLCPKCHNLVSGHQCEDWRQWTMDRNWLDAGGRLA